MANLNQMIEAVSRDGYVIAQEYLPRGRGGRHATVPDERPAARRRRQVRRVPAGLRRRRLRSNVHAGGRIAKAAGHRRDAALAEIVRPKLVRDGMFLVGLDIVGDKLMEINVFSPGGLGTRHSSRASTSPPR